MYLEFLHIERLMQFGSGISHRRHSTNIGQLKPLWSFSKLKLKLTDSNISIFVPNFETKSDRYHLYI